MSESSKPKLEPPKFMDDAAGYPEYKKKLQRWSRLTKIKKSNQAEYVVYNLEDHPSGIQEKVDTAIGDEIQDAEDGLTKLITFLDTIYAEDDMSEAWNKYKQFIRLKKSPEQSVNEFVAEFDKKHKKAKESGCEFSDMVLGFNLLESCNLSETNEKFVLTAVNFKTGKEQKNLLEQIKNSLKKFHSRDRLRETRNDDSMQFIKQEDVFVSSVKGALVADGWTPPASAASSGALVKKNSEFYKGKKNPLDSQGKPCRCFKCGSEYHMSDKCDETKTETNKTNQSNNNKKKKKKGASADVAVADVEGTALSKLLARASVTDFNMVCSDSRDPLINDCKEPMLLSELLMKFQEGNLNTIAGDIKTDEPESLLTKDDGEQCLVLSDLLTKFHEGNLKVDIATDEEPELVFVSLEEQGDIKTDEPESLLTKYDSEQCLADLLTKFHEGNLKVDIATDEEPEFVYVSLEEQGDIKTDEPESLLTKDDSEQCLVWSDLLMNFREGNLKVDIATDEEPERVFVSLEEQELCLLIEEAGVRGVLDTACSRSVAGFCWIQNYTNAISPSFAQTLNVLASTKVYQFGGGEKRQSHGILSLPIVLGNLKITISIEIVDAQIPLLIGSNSMKLGEAIINFQDNTAIFFKEVVDMCEVGAGHFCIDLLAPHVETHINDVEERDKLVQHVLTTDEVDLKLLKKLHHYYGHTPPDRLLKLLENAGRNVKNLKKPLLEIEKTCEACIRTKKRSPKPKSSIPRVDTANTIVTLDLKEWKFKGRKYYICYMIDMYSRLTMGNFITNKEPDSVVECIMSTWVPAFGLMKGIHSDIGGEFSNTTLAEVASRLGIEVTTTASYSPHQNGLNERNHAIVDTMITRMLLSDSLMKPRIALCWALNAKNSLENCYGFTPFQLHIGRTPMMPSTTRDGPPTFESVTKSENFAAHLNALHAARAEFIKAESSKSLKLAMKSMVYPRGDDIIKGDDIYYKQKKLQKGDPVWDGPSKVVATNGKKLFVDKGARLGTVNRDDSVRKGEELWKFREVKKKEKNNKAEESIARILRSAKLQQCTKKVVTPVTSFSESSSSDENENGSEVSSDGEHSIQEDDESTEEEVGSQIATEEEDVSESESDRSSNDVQEEGDQEEEDDLVDSLLPLAVCEGSQGSVEVERTSIGQIKKHDIIQYVVPETGCTEISVVINRAAKATGKNKFCWNVQVKQTGQQKFVNLQAVKDVHKLADDDDIHPTLVVTIPRNMHHTTECVEAKVKELDNWDQFGVYEEVEDTGQSKVNTNWVLVRKAAGFIKARLCIRGDQEQNKEKIRTDSPTVNKINIKLFFVIAVQNGWHVKTADIKAAFLQGTNLDREVFVRPPIERRKNGIIWKMIKRAYGFVDASRGFYLELKKVLEELGCVMSKFDPALFMYFGGHTFIQGLLLSHVDDLIHGAGTQEFNDVVLEPLKERFTFGSEEEDDFMYVGMHIRQVDSTIITDQDAYVQNLEIPYIDLTNNTNLDDLLDEEGQSDFRSAVGKIGWVSNSSRPDLAFNHLVLSTKIGNASMRDMKLAVKTVKQIKCNNTTMRFVNLGPMKDWVLEGYGDAGYGSLPDKISSSCGYVLLLTNKVTGAASILTWKSVKIRRIVGSSTAAEALASTETGDVLVYIAAVLTELLGDTVANIPLHLITDSKNLHDSLYTTALVDDHRMRIDIARLKESIEKKELSDFKLVSSGFMLADVLTKKGAAGFKLMNILHAGKHLTYN